MQISLEKAVDGFVAFMADQVNLIPRTSDKFVAYAALGALKAKPKAVIGQFKPKLEMIGILNGDSVDLESVKAALDNAFLNIPKASFFGFTFSAEDVPVLLAKMHGTAVPETEAEE